MNLTDPIFSDPDKARDHLEQLRWPDGPICPHCGAIGNAYRLNAKKTSKKPARKGLLKCKDCRKQFSVTVGTIMERSHIPLNKWLLAIQLLCSSKKGMSAHQLHRSLDLTYKSAWFMAHRIRHAMNEGPPEDKLRGIVEVDEVYIGGHQRGQSGHPNPETSNKKPVVSVLERGGRVKSFHVGRVTQKNLHRIVHETVDTSARLMTDKSHGYRGLDQHYASHETVDHGRKEYVRGDVTTNTVEGYFALLQRGIVGTFHHVSRQHLHLYLNEFDFRYNGRKLSDAERAVVAIQAVGGKRLTLN